LADRKEVEPNRPGLCVPARVLLLLPFLLASWRKILYALQFLIRRSMPGNLAGYFLFSVVMVVYGSRSRVERAV